MQYLHTMIRVTDLDASLRFYCDGLGLVETRRYDSNQGRFTLVFLAAPDDLRSAQEHKAPLIELTYNWDPEEYTGGRNFGHLAYQVNDIYGLCDRLQTLGVTINRPPAMDTWHLFEVPMGFRLNCYCGRCTCTGRTVDFNGQHRRLVKSDTIRVSRTKEQKHDEKTSYGCLVQRSHIGIGGSRYS